MSHVPHLIDSHAPGILHYVRCATSANTVCGMELKIASRVTHYWDRVTCKRCLNRRQLRASSGQYHYLDDATKRRLEMARILDERLGPLPKTKKSR